MDFVFSLFAKPAGTTETPRKMSGCLQDQLLAAAGECDVSAKNIASDFGVGLPPRYNKDDRLEVVAKQAGGRVIVWTSRPHRWRPAA